MHMARWDIFCRVIDNFGDIGVCWRLSADLAARGHLVRLWVDDPAALDWMAPGARQGQWERITVCDWQLASDPTALSTQEPADVWVEAFGCELPQAFLAHHVARAQAQAQTDSAWINLEYLSAEPFAERAHRLPSPVMDGPAKGRTKHFFYPGFTAASGGLLREKDLAQRQTRFDRAHWLSSHGIGWQGEQLVAVFCYEPEALDELLSRWQAQEHLTRLLVTQGRTEAAVQTWLASNDASRAQVGTLAIDFLPNLSQTDFDHLLWACDLNLVRGEDSVVRALWAGKPFLWQIYPQHDNAHHAKLTAFLDRLDAPAALRAAHAAWNGVCQGPMPVLMLGSWRAWAADVRRALWQQSDLTSRLIDFVALVQTHGRPRSESR